MTNFIKILKDIILEAIPRYSKKVGDYTYKGFTTADEYNVISKVGKAYDERNKEKGKSLLDIPKYVKYVDAVYDKLISNNPELKDIKINVSGYDSDTFPKHDIVFGALSGIPPEDIKYYVEITKGMGGSYKGKDRLELDNDKFYISPLKK
jgi:hypothetical protein